MATCAQHGCPAIVPSGRCAAHERQRAASQNRHWIGSHPLLHTNRWKQASKRNLAKNPWCVGYPKGFHGANRVLAECTDHQLPVKDYPELAFDEDNFNSMCQDCNKRKGIAEEGGFGR